MKQILGALAVLAAIGVAILGPGRSLTSLRGAQKRASDTIRTSQSDAQLLAEARLLAGDLTAEIAADGVGHAKFRAEIDALKSELADKERSADKTRECLVWAAQLLDTEEARFVVGGKDYTRAEVEADADANSRTLKFTQSHIERLRERLAGMENVLARADARLHEAKAGRIEVAAKIETIETELAATALEEKLRDATDAMSTKKSIAQPGQLAETIGELDRRLATRQALLDEGVAASPGRIDWEQPSDRSLALRAQIKRTLETDSRPAPPRTSAAFDDPRAVRR